MAEEPEDQAHAAHSISTDRFDRAHDRGHTLRMLKRIADILGTPVEDFFKADPERDSREGEVDGARGK